MRTLSSLTVCTLAICSVWPAPGAVSGRSVVGAVVSPGSFRLANTTATGTATLLSGDEVQATNSSPKVMLKNGAGFELLPNASSTFYTDHATLLNGTLRMTSPQPFAVDSGRFIVTATEPRTTAVLQREGDRLVVNVTAGSASVVSGGAEPRAYERGRNPGVRPLCRRGRRWGRRQLYYQYAGTSARRARLRERTLPRSRPVHQQRVGSSADRSHPSCSTIL